MVQRDNEGHYKDKGVNLSGKCNNCKYLWTYWSTTVTELKGEINSNTVLVGDVKSPPSKTDRSSRRITKKTMDVNKGIGQKNLTDIHRTFFPKAEE